MLADERAGFGMLAQTIGRTVPFWRLRKVCSEVSTMRRVLGMAVLLVLCTGFSALAQGVAPRRQQLVMLPDLVILEATYQDTEIGDGQGYHTYTFGIEVKNNGLWKTSVWTSAAVFVVSAGPSGPSARLFGTTAVVSPLASGGTLTVFIAAVLKVSPTPCCVVIVVDAPSSESSLGRINEGTQGELNNGFVFFVSPSTDLQTFENPAFHP
jgi:hypothetical protein